MTGASMGVGGHWFSGAGYDLENALRLANISLFIPLLTGFSILAACGGGDEVVTPPPPPPPPPPASPDYETIYSQAAETSVLAGTGLSIPLAGMEANQIPLLSLSGSVRHDVGPLTLDDGQYGFTGTMQYIDPNDPDQGVYFSEGNGGVYFLAAIAGASLDYVMRYTGEYGLGGETYSAEGIAGIVTGDGFVPTTGDAQYVGVAFGSGATTAGGSFDLLNGSTLANVDFAAGNVSLTASGFTDSGQPVDEIQVIGALLSGAEFSGGTLNLLNDGASAEAMLGANVAEQVSGNFYGWDDTNGIPDELGGVLLKAGDDGYVALFFAAD